MGRLHQCNILHEWFFQLKCVQKIRAFNYLSHPNWASILGPSWGRSHLQSKAKIEWASQGTNQSKHIILDLLEESDRFQSALCYFKLSYESKTISKKFIIIIIVKYIISNAICYTMLYMLKWMRKKKYRIRTPWTRGSCCIC